MSNLIFVGLSHIVIVGSHLGRECTSEPYSPSHRPCLLHPIQFVSDRETRAMNISQNVFVEPDQGGESSSNAGSCSRLTDRVLLGVLL